MADVKPFKAIRPTPGLAPLVAALPYDVMSSDEARDAVIGNPYSFLHVDKAEIDLQPSVDLYDPRVYEKACENLNKMIRDGVLIKDSSENFYIYRQVMNGRTQTGIVAVASIDDYLNGVIKKHENTRADKELDRITHVDRCNANTGPIFLIYRTRADIDSIVNDWTCTREPVYDFISDDGIGHMMWIVNDAEAIRKIEDAFSSAGSLYIADGHHRCASAVKVGLKRRAGNPGFTGNENFNFFLSVLIPDSQIHIMDYNRLVRDLNGHSTDEFLRETDRVFDVERVADGVRYKPDSKHRIGMYLDGGWYRLSVKTGSFDEADPLSRLDVTILQKNILTPILGISDPRTDKRIDFIGGIRGLTELEKRADSSGGVAFAMYPTSIGDLMDIADSGEVMPPKSTWFEPKLRSGLFIHEL